MRVELLLMISGRPHETSYTEHVEARLHHGDCAHRNPTIHGRAGEQEVTSATRGNKLLDGFINDLWVHGSLWFILVLA